MRKVLLVLLALLIIGSIPLFGFSLTVPNKVPGYVSLKPILEIAEGDEEIEEARFYVMIKGEEVPSYARFTETEGVWSSFVPYTVFSDDTLEYFTEIRTVDKTIIRIPAEGINSAVLLADMNPPVLTLANLDTPELGRGTEQLVVFWLEEESGILDFEVNYNGEPIARAGVFENYLSFLVTPDEDSTEKEASVEITITDIYNNTEHKEVEFTLITARVPFFSASAGYTAGLDIVYTVSFGENQNSLVFTDLFNDITQELMLSLDLGAETQLGAGPLVLELSLGISDELAITEVLNAYPSTLISDYQNILRLWHPWNFDNEFTYTQADVRSYENSNHIYAKLSLFDPILSYTFGDQSISFQDQTVKSLGFRGTTVSFDIPFLSIAVGKGLTDLGLYQAAWPQNFFGLNFGLDVFDYWWFQTNVSFISSFQGRYDDITTAGSSPIGTLYDLGSIKPEENMLIGIETGLEFAPFKLTGDLGLTLYVNDASQVIDTAQLATDINSGFGFDIAPYLTYIDAVYDIFPVFDYFPLSMGLAAAAVNRELWGITYGGDLEIPALGLQAWFHKTDKSYKSLGASLSTDLMDFGAYWAMDLGDFSLSAGYDRAQDNIPDILFNDFLPLFGIDLGAAADPTENDIANILHTATAGIVTPSIEILGNVSLDYTFEWVKTNADVLAQLLDAGSAQDALLNSTKNDVSIIHTADLKWKSGKLKFGDFGASIGAKTKDSYVVYSIVDGAPSTSSAWGFSYGVNTSMKLSRFKLDLGFDHVWSTAAASDTVYGYDLKFSVSDVFFDTISLKGSFDQIYIGPALQEYEIGVKIALQKNIGLFSMGLSLDTSYGNSIIDDADNALSTVLEINGGISL
ncbi:MAG: hypothetical protein HQ557_04180 [Bacteroidetes bacterium]|nr:hypothetical protein [Bacteroidota bacterium]